MAGIAVLGTSPHPCDVRTEPQGVAKARSLPPSEGGRTHVLLEPADEVESKGAGVMPGAAGVPWSLSYLPATSPLCSLEYTRAI